MKVFCFIPCLFGLLVATASIGADVQPLPKNLPNQKCSTKSIGLSGGGGKLHYEALCSNCHGGEGEGTAWGPGLRSNLGDPASILRAVSNGIGDMPPVAADLTRKQLLELLNFISNSWGNSYGCVTLD